MPASENISIASMKAITGLVVRQAGEIADLLDHDRRPRRMARMQAKVPSVIAR